MPDCWLMWDDELDAYIAVDESGEPVGPDDLEEDRLERRPARVVSVSPPPSRPSPPSPPPSPPPPRRERAASRMVNRIASEIGRRLLASLQDKPIDAASVSAAAYETPPQTGGTVSSPAPRVFPVTAGLLTPTVMPSASPNPARGEVGLGGAAPVYVRPEPSLVVAAPKPSGPAVLARRRGRPAMMVMPMREEEMMMAQRSYGSDSLMEYALQDEIKVMTKMEGDGEHPAGHYLVVEDSGKPTTWHLRVRSADGTLNHRLMGAAWAAMHGGYRGNKYAGPNKDNALAKLKRLYESEGLDTPSEKSLEGDFLLTVKSLGRNRVGAYAILWGSPEAKDLTDEYFTPATDELTAIFDGVGRLPYLFEHSMDSTIKSRVVGVVDKLVPDDVGVWYEAQLHNADDYDKAIHGLIAKGKLKTSTQTLRVAKRVEPDGRITRWPIVEITATSTPAEWRMAAIADVKNAFGEIGVSSNQLSCLSCEPEESVKRTGLLRIERERAALLFL